MWYELQNGSISNRQRLAMQKRPPGALCESRLMDRCTGCGDCVEVCPKQIIGLDDARLPVVIAMETCGQCGLCADVCTHGAINLTLETRLGLKRIMKEDTPVVSLR
ncbi:NAD-dependent dihydropyrimidine dehydrogenase PreA subunit [Roseovarius sp. MBR-78]|jgi:NAD-dependent dihydropyrimidine dehydrogenase PreA subunit|uniref:4Fe-4S binding protein n=1 Tax=Roseovarius sp. MBR-78 TaxID=3156460 RepID=UPI0033946DDB